MVNSIEKAKIYQKELDRQIVADAATGWMEANAGQVIYHGGDEVKIPKIVMDGLGDYDRGSGYPEGSVTLSYQTMTMTQDRGTSFNIDAMDCDESGLDGLAGTVMGEFQRVHVIPEIDSYRLSKLYALAAGANRVHTAFTPTKSNVLDTLKADIAAVQDEIGENIPLVVHISLPVAALFDSSDALSRQLNATEFESGEVKLKVKAIDNIPLLRTPSARMKTAYTFFTGAETTPKFGYEAQAEVKTGDTVTTPAAKQINWIIMARNAPIAVSRTDTIRIFDPSVYQKANAWHLDYRKYHDLWVPANKLPALYANVGA